MVTGRPVRAALVGRIRIDWCSLGLALVPPCLKNRDLLLLQFVEKSLPETGNFSIILAIGITSEKLGCTKRMGALIKLTKSGGSFSKGQLVKLIRYMFRALLNLTESP